MLEAIKYENGTLLILDQLQLPQRAHYQNISSIKEGWSAIKEMKVRGAPAIAIVAALSLAVELKEKKFESKDSLHDFVNGEMKFLIMSRPTAVNLQKLSDFIISQSERFKNAEDMTVENAREGLVVEIEMLMKADISINKNIGELGGKHICALCGDFGLSILTHCNTGSLATAGYGTALGCSSIHMFTLKSHHSVIQDILLSHGLEFNSLVRVYKYSASDSTLSHQSHLYDHISSLGAKTHTLKNQEMFQENERENFRKNYFMLENLKSEKFLLTSVIQQHTPKLHHY